MIKTHCLKLSKNSKDVLVKRKSTDRVNYRKHLARKEDQSKSEHVKETMT